MQKFQRNILDRKGSIHRNTFLEIVQRTSMKVRIVLQKVKPKKPESIPYEYFAPDLHACSPPFAIFAICVLSHGSQENHQRKCIELLLNMLELFRFNKTKYN